MGNSDSKQSKSSRQSIRNSQASNADETRIKIQAHVMAEFDKNCDSTSATLTSESFHKCLRSVQDKFDLFCIAESPLAVGLFAFYLKERPGGRALMTKGEYLSATSALLSNSSDVTTDLTRDSILQYYCASRQTPDSLTDEVMLVFLQASWRFAFEEMSRKLLSNVWLSGKSESEAISRFSETQIKKLSKTAVGPIVLSVGPETVTVPTSFSTQLRAPTQYPEL